MNLTDPPATYLLTLFFPIINQQNHAPGRKPLLVDIPLLGRRRDGGSID